MAGHLWLALATCTLLGYGRVVGVAITELDVPAVALVGDDVHLRCDYEVERGARIYTLKWYKDNREFYRHLPGISTKPADERCLEENFGSVDGVTVDCWVSTEREVVLEGVTKTSSGDYQCEVIGEHPKFTKEAKKARLTVFSEAVAAPVVEGVGATYRPRDLVALNCTAANAEYIPALAWLVNGHPPPDAHVVQYPSRRVLGLNFVAGDHMFRRGYIEVSCGASLGPHHHRDTQVQLPNTDFLSAQYFSSAGRARDGGRVYRLALTLAPPLLFLLSY